MWNWIKLLGVAFLLIGLFSALSSAEEKQPTPETWPPRQNGFSFPIVMGPEGTGLGVDYIFQDLLGKPGRFLFLHDILTNTEYKQFGLEYHEPHLFLDRDLLHFQAFYMKRTGTHFFGIGPDTKIEDAAYYELEETLFILDYTLPLPANFRVNGKLTYDRVALDEGELEDDMFHADYPELGDKFQDKYYDLYISNEFQKKERHPAWSVTLFHDDQQGVPEAWPTAGGYRRLTAKRVDKNNEADWNYWQYTADAAQFIPLSEDDYNILALHARWDRLDGRSIPFYKLLSLGHQRFSMSQVTDGKSLRGYWENRWVDRNRFLGSVEVRHRTRGGWWPESFDQYKYLKIGHESLLKTSTYLWLDTGNVWPDADEMDGLRVCYGAGFTFHSDTGIAMLANLGFSDELSAYMVFSYYQEF